MTARSPRYLEVAATLDGEIRDLAPNSLLPTEQQLAKRFSLSRVTVRAALDLLERNGQVTRLRGRGTIVSPPKITRRFFPWHSLEQDLTEQGIEYETRVLLYDPAAEPADFVRQRLNLGPGDTVGSLSLVRLVDDRIVCHEHRHYPPGLAGRLDPEDIVNRDASMVVEDLAGASIRDIDWETEIISAPERVAEAMDIAPRILVVANTYLWLGDAGVPLEAGVISYRIDRCKFSYKTRFDRRADTPKDRASGSE
jgi:GntR family transcriptional regulator